MLARLAVATERFGGDKHSCLSRVVVCRGVHIVPCEFMEKIVHRHYWAGAAACPYSREKAGLAAP